RVLAALERLEMCTDGSAPRSLEGEDVSLPLVRDLARARIAWHEGTTIEAAAMARDVARRAAESGDAALEAQALVLANVVELLDERGRTPDTNGRSEVERALVQAAASEHVRVEARARMLLAFDQRGGGDALGELGSRVRASGDPLALWLFLRM